MRSTAVSERTALVVGAGGYLGQAIVAALREEDWKVRGLVHTARSSVDLERLGASAVVGDVLEPGALTAATRNCEAVFHVAAADASGPGGAQLAHRVRVEGCRNILEAARTNRVRRVVVGSGYWVYADSPRTITENSTLDPRGESRVNFDTELAAREPTAGGSAETLVVRPGMVYGDGSWCRSVVDGIRAGSYRYVGEGANAWSFVSLPDAGRGFVRVLERGVSGEAYDLVDGRPSTWKEFGDFLADAMGQPRPGSISRAEAVATMDAAVVHHLTARRACSGAKIRALDWRPRHPDFRSGLEPLLGRWGRGPPRRP